MKKHLLMLLGVLMAVLPALAQEFSYEYEGQTIKYGIRSWEERTVGICEGNSVNGDVIIPPTVTYEGEEFTVSFINGGAFWHCTGMTSIQLPNTIEGIEPYAFSECSSLTSFFVPASVKSIAYNVFGGCGGLTKVEYESIESLCSIHFDTGDANPLSSAHSLYINGEEVRDLVIPETVTSIGDNAFNGAQCLTSVKIPETVTFIGASAFAECHNIATLELPSNITSINAYTFYGCRSLRNMTLPSSLTSIGERAFENCNNLETINIPNSVTQIGQHAFAYCGSLKSINIPEGVNSILTYTFHGCRSLKELSIPNSVVSIGDDAFSECNGLVSLFLPKSVSRVSRIAFAYCDQLRNVVVSNPDIIFAPNVFDRYEWSAAEAMFFCPEGVDLSSQNLEQFKYNVVYFDPASTEILADGTILTDKGKTLLYAAVTDGSYAIPDGVATITSNAFKTAGNIERLTIPASVEVVEADAFKFYDSGTNGLKGINKVNFLDWTAWYENVSLGNINSNPYRECGAYAGGLQVNAPELKEGMTEIKDYINCGLSYNGDVVLPSTLKRIGAYAFHNDGKLLSVVIPEGLEEIAEYAFSGCWGLQSLVVPESVVSIGTEAFAYCSSLKFVVIYNPETQIAYDAFKHSYEPWEECENVQFFCPEGLDLSSANLRFNYIVTRFDPENTTILADGTQLDGEGKKLIYAAVKDRSYTIPAGVEVITTNAFRDVNILNQLTIPGSVREVEADAFKDVSIEKVNFEDWSAWYANVKLDNLYANPYRNGQAYIGNNKIKSIELEEGLTQIGDYVNYGLDFKFRDEVELPSTLTHIGAYAFYNNSELYSVILPAGVETIGDYAFMGCKLLENVELPASLKTIGESAFNGCTSMTEVELPEGLTSLGREAFRNCKAIEKAVLVSGIESIDDFTFCDCVALNKVFLPLNLKRIGESAFNNCRALDDVTFPSSLESIGRSAFSNGSLTKLVLPNSVTELGISAFENQAIESLSIGCGLHSIPEGAFRANKLREIYFSEGLASIGNEAFALYDWDYENNVLSAVKLPSTLNEIAERAFSSKNITELEIPDGVTALPEGSCGRPHKLTIGKGIKDINSNAFSFDNLKVMRVQANTPPALSETFPINKDQNDALTLIVNVGRKNTYSTNARWKQIDHIIEEGTSEVIIYMTGDYALSEEIRTTTGLMPSQVTKMKVVGPLTENDLRIIKENMVALQSLDLSEVTKVTTIPAGQFENSLLSEIILPANTEIISDYAFANCQLLKLSELPETVKFIGSRAFFNCPGLTITRLPEALEMIGESAFDSCNGLREITAGSNLGAKDGREYGMSGGLGANTFMHCFLLEKVDFSATQLTEIASGMFNWCRELDEVILPESVLKIGDYAFMGTAIRDISFASGVKEIGVQAFGHCRRLVAANVPERVESIAEYIFIECPRLISVSMPSGTTHVSPNIVSGDKKLSNISCAALDAPAADNGAFDNIRLRYVSLTVPTLSFRSYLNAPQWGKFECIQNRIPVSIDPGVEVTNVAETEYQDMLKEDALEEAQELASQEKEEPAQVVRRVARRAQARTATNRSFAALFDGAQIQTGTDGAGTRIFINPKEGVNITSVMYAGKEMIDKLQGNTLLLPAGSNGTLEIRTDAPQDPNIGVGIGEINYDEPYEVYDLNGLPVGDSLDTLLPGLYVVRQGQTVKKVAIK